MPASQGGGFLSANFCMVVCSVGMGVVPVVSVSVSSLQARVQWGGVSCVRAFGHSMYLPFLQACPSSEGVSRTLGGWSHSQVVVDPRWWLVFLAVSGWGFPVCAVVDYAL